MNPRLIATIALPLAVATVPVLAADAPPAHLATAVANPARTDEDRARDTDRKPDEVLAFLGIEPGMAVVDLMAGRGYYTEILCNAVGESGTVYLQNNEFVRNRFADEASAALIEKLGVERCVRLDRELEDLGLPDDSLDAAIMVLFYHDTYWQKVDRPKMNAGILRALKPGGVFGVVDHHAEAGSKDRDVKSIHRVDASIVKKELVDAGFVLEAESDLLSHPEDDRTKNVFDPSIRGKTDRFIYRFRKPAR